MDKTTVMAELETTLDETPAEKRSEFLDMLRLAAAGWRRTLAEDEALAGVEG